MSYDLHLFRPQQGVDPLLTAQETYGADEDDLNPGESIPETEAAKAKLTEALINADPRLEPFKMDYAKIAAMQGLSEAEARRQYRHVELNCLEDGLQITLFDNTVSVTLPYWHSGTKAETVWNEVWTCLNVCHDVEQFAVYDPQLDKVLDLQTDLGLVRKSYLESF